MKHQPKVSRVSILNAIEAVLSLTNVRQAVVVQHPDLTVKATRQRKPDGRTKTTTLIVTIGRPAYAERHFIKMCKQAGEPFPVRKVQLKFYPAKK